MVKTNDGLDLDEQLCFATYAASQAFSRVYRSLLDPLGITYAQFLVMMVLWGGDGVTVSHIGTRLHLDSGTLTPLLKRLEKAGLIKRERNPLDEREVRVSLTRQGQELRAKAAAARESVACATKLSRKGISSLKEQLIQLREDLLRAGA